MATKKKQTLEEIEDDIKSVSRKQAQAFLDYNKCSEELAAKMQEYYELNPAYVKIKCFQCKGTGYLKQPDSSGKERKIKCNVCDGNMFLWLEKYIEK